MASTSTLISEAPPPRRTRRWRNLLKRSLQVLVVLMVLVLMGGATFELIAEHLDALRFPQQGKSIPLGAQFPNVSLNLDCSGPAASGPTIILESSLGLPAYSWKPVQEQVAQFARVCSYDRAGYGWSSAGPLPRTSLEIAKELHALLTAASEKGPFVIVGHSFGGYNVRVYTGLYPQDIAGVVLVDASHEDQAARLPAALRVLDTPPSDTQVNVTKLMLHLGVTRMVAGAQDLPDDFLREVWMLTLSAKYMDAKANEMRSFDQSAEQVRAAGRLGDLPLIVLTAGKTQSAAGLPPGITQKDLEDHHRIWTDELQVSEMHLSTRGKRIIVADSGHMIPLERPDAVAGAIREVWQAARDKSLNTADSSITGH